MIKKLIYTIGALMFMSAIWHPFLGLAAGENEKTDSSNCEMYSIDIKCRFGDQDVNKGLDWGDSFGETDPAKVGKDLYKIIYNKTEVNTASEAMKNTAAKYGMQESKMRLIVGGNITPLIERNPLMRIEDAERIYGEMMETYNRNKESADLKANILANVEPNEMFADNDLENSGFDLINDLNNIEIILFKNASNLTMGAPYNPKKDGNNESNTAPVTTNIDNADLNPLDNASIPNVTDEKPVENKKTNKSPFDSVGSDDRSQVLGGVNPNQCFGGSEMKDALNKFQDELPNNEKLKSNWQDSSNAGSGAGVKSGGSGTGSNGNASGNNDWLNSDSTAAANQVADVQAAPAGDWSQKPVCDGVLCVSLDFIKKPVVPGFNKTDNCIQCHVQYINNGLQKTLAHSLIPAKATGNFMESSVCKNAAGIALGSVGMNVTIKTVPIVTPVKDPTVDVGFDLGISKSAKDFARQTDKEWDLFNCKRDPQACADKKAKAKDDTSIDISNTERELLIAINTAADGATQGSIFAKAAEASQTSANNANNEVLLANIAEEAYGQAKTYQSLEKEMQVMNDYFLGFKGLFNSLLMDVPGLNSTKACVKLKETPACT